MATEGQIRELFSIAMNAVPQPEMQHVIEKPHDFITHVRAFFTAISTVIANPRELLERRIAMLARAGFTWDLPLVVPDLPPGFTWPIPVPKGMTPNRAFALCEDKFSCWRWTEDLDAAVTENDRDPAKGSYVVWVRSRIEADEELKGLSANMLHKQGIHGITLTERLLLARFHFEETGGHLDIENWSLCSGSRYLGGGVPSVYCNPARGKLHVFWGSPGGRSGGLRAREVVS